MAIVVEMPGQTCTYCPLVKLFTLWRQWLYYLMLKSIAKDTTWDIPKISDGETKIKIQLLFFVHFWFFCPFSLAVHPNKLLIATGQATGHDRREGRVSCAFPDIYFKGIFLQQFF